MKGLKSSLDHKKKGNLLNKKNNIVRVICKNPILDDIQMVEHGFNQTVSKIIDSYKQEPRFKKESQIIYKGIDENGMLCTFLREKFKDGHGNINYVITHYDEKNKCSIIIPKKIISN